ncbi:unnamed protein product [Tilletia controversa]|nr:unnamed protein product [Tilletia controversa]
MSEQTIYRALCPRVVVLSSPDVAVIARDNGCDDFAQLLRPFEAQIQNITVRTSQLAARPCSTFPLRIDQLSSFEDGISSEINRHPEEVLDAVIAHISTHVRRWDAEVPRIEVAARADVRPEHVQTPVEQLAPWFADFRDLILGHRAVSEHETFGHPVAMLLAVSSTCPNAMDAFAQLHEQSQQPTAYTQRPYMHLDVLRYYLILHDVSRSGNDLAETKQLLDNVRATYGLHCCILTVNSAGEGTAKSEGFSTMWSRALQRDPRAPLLRPNIGTPEPRSPGVGDQLGVPVAPARWHTPTPEQQKNQLPELVVPVSPGSPHTQGSEDGHPQHTFGEALDDEDVRRLKSFMREFVAQSLVPHMEKCVQVWNEQVAASRRGITSKLFGAGRRMFGATRAPVTQPPGFDAHRQIYPAAAIESLTRRLADFAFMTRDLKLAASLYEMVRKDFVTDKAWKYAAGASEMLGLCQLLQASASATASSAEAEALLGQACHEFSLGNHTQLSAIRASLLFYEAQRSIRDWRNVESVLIRAAGFAEEISSAIVLEQAAFANLRQPKPALRKFAVRLVMAGHRYNDCGQRYLSLRCFAQAAFVYRAKDWRLIANHIEHELGKQAYMQGSADQADEHALPAAPPTEDSTTPAVQAQESQPQLAVELVEPPSQLHHGEEAEVTARLVNVGQDHLYHIRLSTNDASCLALKQPNDQHDVSAGTLELPNSLSEDAPVDIALPSGKLGKGESIEIVLRLRASWTGPLTLSVQLVYQNEAKEVFNARIQHILQVLPSLLITSDCAWLSDDRPRVLVDLTIANVSAELQGLQITGITAITTDKRIHFPSESSLDGLGSSIDPSSTIHIPVTLEVEVNAEEDDVLLVKQLRSLLGRKKDDKASPLSKYPPKLAHLQQLQFQSSEVLSPSPFLGAARKAWRLRVLSHDFNAVSELDRRRVFPVFDVNELDLIIHWEQSGQEDSSSQRRHGTIPVFGIRLGPLRNRLETLVEDGKSTRNLYAEAAKEQAAVLKNLLTSSLGVTENPVMITLSAEGIVAHDFEQGALRVPISFKLRNLSDRLRATFRLTLVQSEEDADAPLAMAPWVGRASFRGQLEAGAPRVITASMLVETPAVMSSGMWSGEILVEGGISGSGYCFVIAGTERMFVNVQQSST